jgi:hypothetical protein
MSRSIWVGLAIAAIGIPLAASTEWLQKRSTDGVYLANCYETKNSTWTSQLPYYSNALTGSQNGEFPDDNTYASPYGVVQWEGNRVASPRSSYFVGNILMINVVKCATYPDTGVQFCSSIIADTWSLVRHPID